MVAILFWNVLSTRHFILKEMCNKNKKHLVWDQISPSCWSLIYHIRRTKYLTGINCYKLSSEDALLSFPFLCGDNYKISTGSIIGMAIRYLTPLNPLSVRPSVRPSVLPAGKVTVGPTHVFTTSIYYGLNVENSPNLYHVQTWERVLWRIFNSGRGHRWWEIEQSPREGPWQLSQCPRALWEFLGALPEGLFYLPHGLHHCLYHI